MSLYGEIAVKYELLFVSERHVAIILRHKISNFYFYAF